MAKKKNSKKAKAGTKKAVKKVLVKKAKKAAKKAVKKAKKLSSPKKKAKPATKLKKVAKKPVKKAAKPAKKQSKKATPVKKVVKKVAKKQKVVAKKKTVAKSNPIKLKKASPKKPVKSNKPPLPSIISHPGGETETHSFVAHKSHLRAGSTAPYFEAKDQHGNTVNLYSLNGKTVILYFYPKDDTPGCTKEACSLRDEYKYLSDNNYAVIGVSADDAASHSKFAAKYELPFPLLADTDMAIIKAYDVWGQKMLAGRIYDGIVRTTFIIDGYGIIQNVIHEVNTENHAQQILAL